MEKRAAPSRPSETGLGSQSSNTPQHNEQLLPSRQVSLESSGAVGQQAEDDKIDNSRLTSTNDKAWKLLLKTRKQSYKHELEGLQDIHEDELRALKADHREEIVALKAEKASLQKRIQELESVKATMEAGFEAKIPII